MTTFKLELALDAHVGNPAAQHHLVREFLAAASQAIGSSPERRGELTTPTWDASRSTGGRRIIGSWKFEDSTTEE